MTEKKATKAKTDSEGLRVVTTPDEEPEEKTEAEAPKLTADEKKAAKAAAEEQAKNQEEWEKFLSNR